MINTKELREAANAVYLTIEVSDAKQLSVMLLNAVDEIEELKELAIWMTGCGYDFCQHEYFCKKRDELLK